MKKLSMVLALLGVVAFGAQAADNNEVGLGTGIVIPGPDANPCPPAAFLLNADGSYENGYAWQYGGVVPPNYGAFAEGYNGAGNCCGVGLFLTTLQGYYFGQNCDVYVWDSAGANPNNVLSMTPGVVPGAIAFWPAISQHDIDSADAAVNGDFFVGYWGNWPGQLTAWFVAADLDGFGGLPRTNIAPGIGYPTGWQDPSVVWGPTQSVGIGAYVGGEVPVENTTWGAIKNLY
jgi:hypothetical protein